MNAIYVENLYYTYDGENYVLNNINLKIRYGEKVAIMGENGAGKTTLVKHFNGLLKPTKGKVIVMGMDTRKVQVSKLARYVGLVFQNPDHQLFAETVEEEIAFALKNFGFKKDIIKRRVEWALRIMDLLQYRSKSPFLLSGGERKRLAIASVLSYDPQIVIFDEPTTGQDFLQKQKIKQILNLLSLQGKTIIVVTHDIEFAAENFDRIIVLARGRVLADGSPLEVFFRENILKEARLIPPQVAKCTILLNKLFKKNVIKPTLDYYELFRQLNLLLTSKS